MDPAAPPRDINMAAVVGLESPEPPGSPQVKTLQYTRRGLKMVGEEKSLFDLEEPVWHPDEKVCTYALSREGWLACVVAETQSKGGGGGWCSACPSHSTPDLALIYPNPLPYFLPDQ